jgi:hypothetical protein
MAIGKDVHAPVQQDAGAHTGAPAAIRRAVPEVAEQAAEAQVRVGAGQDGMGKVVQDGFPGAAPTAAPASSIMRAA